MFVYNLSCNNLHWAMFYGWSKFVFLPPLFCCSFFFVKIFVWLKFQYRQNLCFVTVFILSQFEFCQSFSFTIWFLSHFVRFFLHNLCSLQFVFGHYLYCVRIFVLLTNNLCFVTMCVLLKFVFWHNKFVTVYVLVQFECTFECMDISNPGDIVQKWWRTMGQICPVLSTIIFTWSPWLENYHTLKCSYSILPTTLTYMIMFENCHFSVWLFSNPGDNIPFLLKFYEARILEWNIQHTTYNIQDFIETEKIWTIYKFWW